MLAGLLPDPAIRASFTDALPRVPTDFLDERLPDDVWQGRAGYLQLSGEYAGFANASLASGWPVERRDLDHLAILTRPAEVSAAIIQLLDAVLPSQR